MLIDTHCHVYSSEMENAEEIIKDAGKNDISLILNGTDPSSNREVLYLADKYDNVFAALGYLYSFADDVKRDDIFLLDRQLKNKNVVGVGEIGLDYYLRKDNKTQQKDLFENMLLLSKKHDLPVIVHSRKSFKDIFDLLKKHGVRGCLHSYSGSAEMALEFVKLGFYIGIGGNVTYPQNRKIKKVIEKIDISNVLVESDSPYLTPFEKKGELNTPMNLSYIIKKLAYDFKLDGSEVEKITSRNAVKLFALK